MELHQHARSLKGHAAQSGVDKWVAIQNNTFMNWTNEQLRSANLEVSDFETDFDSGVKLCALIEALQGKRIKVIKNPRNHHQQLANVADGLTAIANDNIRLVNIGPEDIVNGNLKLILGLVWHLILRYQIGKSKFPTKKLMLAWLQAVIPECHIGNFTSDWNNGIALHALIEWCKPGLCPNWRHLSGSDGLNNCRNAMELAKEHFDIPLVVRPEDLSSSDLDELSGMTYLSYFMKLDSPGYHGTLNLVRRLLRSGTVTNFTSDWNDGRLLCNLVSSVGGHVTGWPTLSSDPIENMQAGINGAKGLGIEPLLTAKELTDPDIDHIGPMAYAAYFSSFKPLRTSAEKVVFSSLPQNVSVGQEASFGISLEDDEVSPGDIRGEVQGPDTSHVVHFNWEGRRGEGYFTPMETGLHRLNVYCEDQVINGCPASFKVLADRSKVSLTMVESCSIGTHTELLVNSASAGQGEVQVLARAPSGRTLDLTALPRHGGNYVSNFSPSEVGTWEVSVMWDGEHISGSPYNVSVFDPSSVKVYGLEGGVVGNSLNFTTDASDAGSGDVRVRVEHEGQYVHSGIYEDRQGVYKIDFTPEGAGSYQVYVYFNDTEVRGSPYNVEIGDSSNVTVSGDGLNLVSVHKTACFEIKGASAGKVEVDIQSPAGQRVPVHLNKLSSGSYTAQFIPSAVGDHKVTVTYAGKQVEGSPYTVRVYDSSQVVVSNMPTSSVVGNAVVFDIDASRAGSGNIEIMINDGEIACSVQNHGNYKFTASFIPINAEPHRVEMKFNSEHVTGSPWKIPIVDPTKMTLMGSGLEFAHVHKTAWFTIGMHSIDRKKLSVKIIAPTGVSVPCKVDESNNEINVEYIATEVGDHTIKVMYGDQLVNGCPYIAKAYNTAAIRVEPPQDGVVGQPIQFEIDVTQAGEGQLEIMVNNGNLPNQVESEKSGEYRISFVPVEAGRQTVDIIFNKDHHPSSPFTCNAVDLSVASVRDLELQVAVDRETSFYVNTESVNQDLNANVDIISPTSKDVPVKYRRVKRGQEKITFTPKEVGVHRINVSYLGATIGQSPYFIKTYDAKQVRLSKMPLGILNIPFKFRVLGELAGDGKMEVFVETDRERISSELTPIKDGTFEVTFFGRGERMHTLNVLFQGEHIPGSPFKINFADVDKIKIQKPSSFLMPCDRQVGLNMTSAPSAIDDLVIHIEGPVYNSVPYKLRNVAPRQYRLDWLPVKPGTYDVDVKYGNVIPVWGSPMKIKVYDSKKVRLVPMGLKLEVGERHLMKFDVSGAGEGDLHVIVLSEARTVSSHVEGSEGTAFVSFMPSNPKLYEVFVAFNSEPIPGSPFKIDLRRDEPDARALALLNTKYFIVQDLQWYFLHTLSTWLPVNHLTMYITAPTGERVYAEVHNRGDGNFKVDWTPRTAGRHTVEILYAGQQVSGSPFYVDVFDLATIRVGDFRHGIVGDMAAFSVDFSAAGTLNQEIQVVGPSGHDVTVDTRDLGLMSKEYMYEPEEAGKYRIYVRYGGFELPGCPFIQEIEDGGLPTASGGGLYMAEEDRPAHFNVDVGRRKGDLRVSVSGPNSIAKCSVDPQSDGSYTVTYIPVETGIFDISVTWNGTDIPGSPYHPKVLDARKVKIIGGWQHFMDSSERVNLMVGERKQLPFDVSEAGPGSLRAEVKGPSSSVDVDIDQHVVGRSTVEFTPIEEGNHYIHLFWSDIPLESSPYLGYAVKYHADPSKLILTGKGLKEAIVREEAEFMIDGAQAGAGQPEVVLSGVRAEVNVKVVPIGNGKFRCSYMPMVPGAYLLHITWNGRQLRGSPYKVNVIAAVYPNKVIVSGDALRGGILGRESEVRIDTRKAGPGELTAYCMGPHQVAYCELEDSRDGTFRLGVKAQEPGRHVLQIKYGGEHVQGSPFVFKVTSQPDASKVRVTGPGVEHGILATFVSRFTVETKGAGAGQLTVRIRGPKGGFQVEMYRESQRERTILCRYDPTETGLYIVNVKWSGVDVPGSPFHAHICDTQEELEQVLNDVSYSMGTSHSHTLSYHGSQNAAPQPRASRMGYSQWREQI